MKINKVLFIGLGGAGQRHLRILKQLLPPNTGFLAFRRTNKTPLLRADFTVDEGKTLEKVYGIDIYNNLDQAFEQKPDLTVISTPTSCHKEPLLKAMNMGSGIIVEKPWAEDLVGFNNFRKGMLQQQLPFLISFQRRYHPLIAKAYNLFSLGMIGKPMAASFTVYSDVTTWHGYEDWHTLYAVRKDLGGGVLLTEIHEIDLACWFFGLPKAVHCTGGNRSSESIDVEDTVQMTLIYEDFSVQLTLCFMHKKKMRHFYIAGTDGALSWNEEGNTLSLNSFTGKDEEFTAPGFTNDSMFIKQAEDFVQHWSQKHSIESLFAAGNSLAVVEAAQISIKSGQVITVIQNFN